MSQKASNFELQYDVFLMGRWTYFQLIYASPLGFRSLIRQWWCALEWERDKDRHRKEGGLNIGTLMREKGDRE